ncbi:MAG: hypothetical protein [Bacteriophage sp.]|nr:MAG: hypothetical protein [Bacteriophage sp.]
MSDSKKAHKPKTYYPTNDLVLITFQGREYGRHILGGIYRYFERLQGRNASNINRDVQIDNVELKRLIDRKIAVRRIVNMRKLSA